jgi:hypothetical protein
MFNRAEPFEQFQKSFILGTSQENFIIFDLVVSEKLFVKKLMMDTWMH